jgi:protein gp37
MSKSKIEWTESTWSPVIGCTKCSPGCENCYAEKMAMRLAAMEYHKLKNHLTPHLAESIKKYMRVVKNGWNGEIYCNNAILDKPLHWRKPRMIFVCSMSDLFHPKVPFDFIDKVIATTQKCPQHTFQCLSKRPKIMQEYINQCKYCRRPLGKLTGKAVYIPLPNLWLGVSVCTPEEKKNIEILKQITAVVRFVSFEPLLGDMGDLQLTSCREDDTGLDEFGQHIDWVIVGGESKGRGIGRQCKLEWVQSIVEQCKAANVPVFVKQIHIDGKLIKMPKGFPQEYPK